MRINIKTIGSDPEFLLINKDNDEYVSSEYLISGDKDLPTELKDLGRGFTIQKDNVLVEFSVPPSDFNRADELWRNINLVMSYTKVNILPSNIDFVSKSFGKYTDSQLDSDLARTFGCSESYNAWSESVIFAEANETNFRYAGFHIHLGYDNCNNPPIAVEMVKALDLFVGVPSVIFDEDKSNRRDQYGKAGEFRITSYGLEYRVLGSYIMNSKNYFDAVIEGIKMAQEFVNDENSFSDEESLDIQTAINSNNLSLSKKLIEKYNMEERILSKVFELD